MSAHTTKVNWLVCDRCAAEFGRERGLGVQSLRAVARRHGWSRHRSGRDLCHTCTDLVAREAP